MKKCVVSSFLIKRGRNGVRITPWKWVFTYFTQSPESIIYTARLFQSTLKHQFSTDATILSNISKCNHESNPNLINASKQRLFVNMYISTFYERQKWMEHKVLKPIWRKTFLLFTVALLKGKRTFAFCFQETLSRSCMCPGMAVKREQRSYSSLSRSQQRTAGGMFGSRTVGTGGTGVAHESSECSGISTRDECSQNRSPAAGNFHANPEQENFLSSTGKTYNGKYLLTQDSSGDLQRTRQNTRSNMRSNKDLSPTSNSSMEIRSSLPNNAERRPKDNTFSNNTQYLSSRKAASQSNEKKWWQLFKWIPGIKSMTLDNRFMYTIPIRKEAKSLSNNREEYSMTVTNFNGSSLSAVDSRPVWNCVWRCSCFETIC